MNFNPIVIVGGEPQSIFLELILKTFNSKSNNFKKPIILISSKNVFDENIKKFKKNFRYNLLNTNLANIKKNQINLFNIEYTKFSFYKKKISTDSNLFITKSFDKAVEIMKKKNISGIINGPISKQTFLRGAFNGITEYLAKKTKSKNPVMLIFNNKLSVSPLTTHIPLSQVSKEIKKKKIIMNVIKIHEFYKKFIKRKPKIAITGLNPHCESFDKENKEKNEIIPAIKYLKKKKYNIQGPFASDTIFLRQNVKKFDVILGMYHDQVLGPMKTLYGFKAINITLGLPFIRISPDHGPNIKMFGKNKSDPKSLIDSIAFFKKYVR